MVEEFGGETQTYENFTFTELIKSLNFSQSLTDGIKEELKGRVDLLERRLNEELSKDGISGSVLFLRSEDGIPLVAFDKKKNPVLEHTFTGEGRDFVGWLMEDGKLPDLLEETGVGREVRVRIKKEKKDEEVSEEVDQGISDVNLGVSSVIDGDLQRLVEKDMDQAGYKKLGRIFLAEILPGVRLGWFIRQVDVYNAGFIVFKGVENKSYPGAINVGTVYSSGRFGKFKSEKGVDVHHIPGTSELEIMVPMEFFQKVLMERWKRVKKGVDKK